MLKHNDCLFGFSLSRTNHFKVLQGLLEDMREHMYLPVSEKNFSMMQRNGNAFDYIAIGIVERKLIRYLEMSTSLM